MSTPPTTTEDPNPRKRRVQVPVMDWIRTPRDPPFAAPEGLWISGPDPDGSIFHTRNRWQVGKGSKTWWGPVFGDNK